MKHNLQYQPNPGPQTWAHQSTADILGFGGARGGGKSIYLLFEALRYINFPDYKALITRRTYKLLGELMERAHKIYPALGLTWEGPPKNQWRAPSGATIRFLSFQHKKDADDFIGAEIQFLGIDQAEQFTWEIVEKLESCVRSTNKEIPTRVRYTSNPGGIGHGWFKKLFVDACRPVPVGKAVYIPQYKITYQPILPGPAYTKNGQTYQFIPSRVFDNPFIVDNDPKYIWKLIALPETLRKAYLFGSYDAFVGQYFRDWDYDTHTCEPFKIPPIWSVYGAFDWGFKHPACYLLGAMDFTGQLYIVNEHVQHGWNVPKHAARIRELDEPFQKQIVARVADPSMWHSLKHLSGDVNTVRSVLQAYPSDDSIAQIFQRLGVLFNPANNDRVVGWQAVREMMPKMKVFSTCTRLIEAIPAMVHDDKKPEDMLKQNADEDGDGGDDTVDTLRYLVNAITAPEAKINERSGWREKVKMKQLETQIHVQELDEPFIRFK